MAFLVYYFIYSSARKVFRKIATQKNFVKMQHMFRKAWKAGFPLANFFIQSDFFRSKTVKSSIGSYFFYFEKSGQPMRNQQNVASYEKIASGKPA